MLQGLGKQFKVFAMGQAEHQHIKYNNKLLENGIEKSIRITDFKRQIHKYRRRLFCLQLNAEGQTGNVQGELEREHYHCTATECRVGQQEASADFQSRGRFG